MLFKDFHSDAASDKQSLILAESFKPGSNVTYLIQILLASLSWLSMSYVRDVIDSTSISIKALCHRHAHGILIDPNTLRL